MDRQSKRQLPIQPARRAEPLASHSDPASDLTEISPQQTTTNTAIQRALKGDVSVVLVST